MAYYNNLLNYRDNIAAIDENGEQITYQELHENTLLIRGVAPEHSLVFAFCNNSIGALCGYVSFLTNNVVPLLLKDDIEKELRENLIETYQPAFLYVPESIQEQFSELQCCIKLYGYCLLRTEYPISTELYLELALLLTTSGSTGSPKLVRQSYRNIQSNAEAIASYLELSETERPITTLPMNYTYGLSIINSHLLVGATILLTNASLMTKEFWTFFKEYGATSFGGVPYTYEILKKLRFFNMELPSLRTMTQAGGKLSPELHKEFAEFAQKSNKRFIVMYGQTEATARMAYLPPEVSLEKYGSMGKAIPGGRLWLKDIEGHEITQPDVVGELIYEGSNVTLGYAVCLEDLIKADERNGVLETGDMAKLDQDGYFYIVGRMKRFLKIYGNRVNLDETERMIKNKYSDMECACAGIDDRLIVFVTDNRKETKDGIKKYLAMKTGININAFQVEFIEEIPKGESGKTLYSKLNLLLEKNIGKQ
ncbi:MAG: Long-chain-fatty-acid--CoA ligase [Herbinix sp.]|nr:Long-chain-fatty-acid--CoA ligase [Herbinix sp.]